MWSRAATGRQQFAPTMPPEPCTPAPGVNLCDLFQGRAHKQPPASKRTLGSSKAVALTIPATKRPTTIAAHGAGADAPLSKTTTTSEHVAPAVNAMAFAAIVADAAADGAGHADCAHLESKVNGCKQPPASKKQPPASKKQPPASKAQPPASKLEFQPVVVPQTQLSAYEEFRRRSGCELVYCETTKRHVMVLPGAVPKPPAFSLASSLYQRRKPGRDTCAAASALLARAPAAAPAAAPTVRVQ